MEIDINKLKAISDVAKILQSRVVRITGSHKRAANWVEFLDGDIKMIIMQYRWD